MERPEEENELNKIILGFNVKAKETKEIKLIVSDVIYKIVENKKFLSTHFLPEAQTIE